MKNMKVYEYDKCSTCKKALKFLDQKKVKYEKIAIVNTPPTEAELRKMLSFLDGDLKRLFNTSGVLYREMGLSEKLKTMSVDEAIRLLSENGKLVKRPFAIANNKGLIGFNETEWKKWLE